MDRFQALTVFVKVADLGSFSAAARQLTMSPPSVTRAIATIEDRLGTRLFTRTTRSVRLTESGERFLQDSRRILIELEEAEAAAVGSHAAPRGNLNITAPVLFGRMFVTPILGEYLNEFPLVNCQTLFVDRIVNMMDEGQDVAIRIGELPDSSLTAIRVGQVRRTLFASPEYLKKYGLPQHPQDLSDHRLVHSLALGSAGEWQFQDKGSPLSISIEPKLKMNTNDAVLELCLKGWGISRLLSYQIAPYLNDHQLKTILSSYELPALPVHVVHQEGRLVSAKVRSFVDYMVEKLRTDPTLN
jgi:DNA-binding transcriptional LysR family regulator